MKAIIRVWAILLVMVIAFAASGLPEADAASQSNSSAGTGNIESRPYTADTATQGTASTTELPSMGWYLFKMVASLALIGGLAYLTIRLFPRNVAFGQGGEYISVYDQYALGQNKGIYIAEIGGKVLALGVTDNNIAILSEITDGDLIRDMRENHVARRSESPVEQGTWEKFLGTLGAKRDIPFSTHISRKISKLQQITQGEQRSVQGKDDKIE